MCYEIRELTGKKTREDTVVQRPGSQEVAGHPKVEALMRAWLGKLGPKRDRTGEERGAAGGSVRPRCAKRWVITRLIAFSSHRVIPELYEVGYYRGRYSFSNFGLDRSMIV
jgi:hypothetical protein